MTNTNTNTITDQFAAFLSDLDRLGNDRLVTLAKGSTAVWRVAGTGATEEGDYVVLDAVSMDGHRFCPDDNHTPRMYSSMGDVTLYIHHEGGA